MDGHYECALLTEHQPSTLPLTGERTLPGISQENYWFCRHLIAYEYIKNHCKNKRILDTGAGEGYGAALLSEVADNVTAIDYDATVIEHINATYPGVTALLGNLYELDVLTATQDHFDVIVNFQVIEHLWDQDKFVSDVAQALVPSGILFMSTPNRLTFSPGLSTPVNPFHTRELSPTELYDLLSHNGFGDITILGIHHGEKILSYEHQREIDIIQAQISAAMTQTAIDDSLLDFIINLTADDFITHSDDLSNSLDLLAIAVKK